MDDIWVFRKKTPDPYVFASAKNPRRVTVVLPLILMIPILLVPPLRDRPEPWTKNPRIWS